MSNIPYRPISRVKDLLESVGQEMSYAYEDLIFPAHSDFILQMGELGPDLQVHFHQDCEAEKQSQLLDGLRIAGANFGLNVRMKGHFIMEEAENSELKITFQP